MIIDGFPQPHSPLPLTNTGLGSELVAAYVNANSTDKHGNTALIYAAQVNNISFARLLIEDGADINAQNYAGSTALHHAALRGHREIVRLLLRAGANPNKTNKHEETALICAAYAGRYTVVPLLLQYGADPYLNDLHKRNALNWAVVRNQVRTVEELLRCMAKSAPLQIDANTLTLAASHGHVEIYRLLSDAQQNKFTYKSVDGFLDF